MPIWPHSEVVDLSVFLSVGRGCKKLSDNLQTWNYKSSWVSKFAHHEAWKCKKNEGDKSCFPRTFEFIRWRLTTISFTCNCPHFIIIQSGLLAIKLELIIIIITIIIIPSSINTIVPRSYGLNCLVLIVVVVNYSMILLRRGGIKARDMNLPFQAIYHIVCSIIQFGRFPRSPGRVVCLSVLPTRATQML